MLVSREILPLGVILMALPVLMGCGNAYNPARQSNAYDLPTSFPHDKIYTYLCEDNFTFGAEFLPNETLVLRMPDHKVLELHQTRAASGIRYEDEQFIFQGKGAEATLTLSGTQRQCHSEGLEGESVSAPEKTETLAAFKAIGTEPGWSLSIHPAQEIEFVGDYGDIQRNVRYVNPLVNRQTGTHLWEVKSDATHLSIQATPQTCNDGMSDHTYSHRVTVTLDEPGKPTHVWHGCGNPGDAVR